MRLFRRDRSPYWWGEFTVDGRQHRFSTKRPISDKKGANLVLSQAYDKAMNASQFGAKPEITLAEAMESVVRSVSLNTQRTYRSSMRAWLGEGRPKGRGLSGSMTLSALKQSHLEAHKAQRRAEGKKANTIHSELRFLKRVVNAHRRGFATADLEFDMPKTFQKTRFLTKEELEAVLGFLKAKSNQQAYSKAHDLGVFLWHTGMRLNEALGLAWTDVDLPKRTVQAYRGKTHVLSLVPLSDAAAGVLMKYQHQKQPFENMSLAVRRLRAAIDAHCNTNPRVVEQRGKATAHSLRDTFAAGLVSKGMSLHKVSKLLGHTSLAMTRKYAQLEAQDVAEEARNMLNAQ